MGRVSTARVRPIVRTAIGIGLIVLTGVLSWTPTAADQPQCVVCRARIAGSYVVSEGRAFCSQACYRQTLPQCAACGKRIEGRFVGSGDRFFCSDTCFESTLPACELCGKRLRRAVTIGSRVYCEEHAKGPFCSRCALPFTKGYTLDDKRLICEKCHPLGIFDEAQAARLFARARETVRLLTGLKTATAPPLTLVGVDAMPGVSEVGDLANLVQKGLYERSSETTVTRNARGRILRQETTVSKRVSIICGLDREDFLATAAHELTHDLLAEFFPAVSGAPTWVEEGICQYVAALVCRREGFAQRLAAIETCRHPEYGDGYRHFKRRCGPDGWPRLVRWLQETDLTSLPATAPL